MPVEIADADFDAMVDDALDSIPPDLARLCANVVVLVEEWPTPPVPRNTLGLYHGVSLPDRQANHAGGLPDQILIYRQPLLAYCRDEGDLRRQIEITIAHEIAHFFGIGHDLLDELGYG
ncbi:MAG TPA: metallopeptidase family protein [Actinomycetota bacterium]|nr:metallopeptidase family protein [Actinomycetota bacterium]